MTEILDLRKHCEIVMNVENIINILDQLRKKYNNDDSIEKYHFTNYETGKLSLLTDNIPTPHTHYSIFNTDISVVDKNNTTWYLYVFMIKTHETVFLY